MQQINYKNSLGTASSVPEELKEKFKEVTNNSTVNIDSTRLVTLIARSCCGCGCSNINISREVPMDSPLQDGDFVTDYHKSDKVL